MRAVVQRVSRASVAVDGETIATIERGLLALVGVGIHDDERDADALAQKIGGLRIFEDAAGAMNRALDEVGGAVLVVSQFTLLGDVRKGRRPSFVGAARGEVARRLYERVAARLAANGFSVATGRFGAMMEVALVNAGPVTILLDTKRTF